MALAISAAYNNNPDNPGFDLSLSGLTGYNTYKVIRVSVGGVFADSPVRGADTVNVVTDTTSVNDYEMPINFAFNWRLEGYIGGVLSSSVTTSTPGTVDTSSGFSDYYGSFWIKNVANPTLSRAMIVSDFAEVDYEPVILSKNNVLGRTKPVVFTDVWGARQGSFSILSVELAGTQLAIADVEALIQSGDVLMYQTAYQSNILRDMYFIVTSLSRTQYTKPGLDNVLEFTYEVGFQEVDRPVTTGLATGYGIWLDLENDPAYTDYDDIAADNATYEDVLNRYTV